MIRILLVALCVAAIVLLSNLKEETARGILNAILFIAIVLFAWICNKITTWVRLRRIKRIREDNRLRKEDVMRRVVIRKQVSEYDYDDAKN